jgi:hypothetical protein
MDWKEAGRQTPHNIRKCTGKSPVTEPGGVAERH